MSRAIDAIRPEPDDPAVVAAIARALELLERDGHEEPSAWAVCAAREQVDDDER